MRSRNADLNRTWCLINLDTFKCQRGAAFVELAIILPFLFVLMVTAWDTMVTIVAKINHRKAAIVIAKDFKQAPLLASYQVVGGSPTVAIERLTLSSAISSGPVGTYSQGFLPSLVGSFTTQLNNSGSGASSFKNSSIVDLKYLGICQNDTQVECASSGKAAGAAYNTFTVNGGDGSEEFFKGPGSDDCFGDQLDAAIEKLKLFREAKLQELLSYSGHGDLHVGILLVDVDTGHPTLGHIVAYAPWRPIVFWLQCSRPPYIFKSSPVLTTGVYFPDTEASYVG